MAKSVLGKDPFETEKSSAKKAGTTKKKAVSTKKAAAKKAAPKKAKATTDKKATTKKLAEKKPTGAKKAVATKKAATKKPEAKAKTPAAPKTADKPHLTANLAAPVKPSVPTTPEPEVQAPAIISTTSTGGVSWKDNLDDGYGYDEAYDNSLESGLDFLYKNYWRVEVSGIANVPKDGRVLLVANHAGILPFDSLMIREAVKREHPASRLLRPLLEDFVYYFPYVGTTMSKLGSVRACQENGQALLNRGEPVLVFPEGIKGIIKPYKKRYRLQRFGRGGFVRLAMATRSPIVPVAVIGSEEAHPLVANMEQIAKVLGLPYLPVTPTFPALGPLGLAPLPSKWRIIFGKPISLREASPEMIYDRILVTKIVEQVRSKLQSMIDKELSARRSPWRS